MAKLDEADPRWLLEGINKSDSKNPGNWHWSEKNATSWSQQRLKELFLEVVVSSLDGASAKVSGVKSIEGEATANNRKGKISCFHEWVMTVNWRGEDSTAFGGGVVEGEIHCPNFSDEFEVDELEFQVTSKTSTPSAERLKALTKNKIVPLLREKCAQYLRELTEEYGKDLVKVVERHVTKSSGEQTHRGVKIDPVTGATTPTSNSVSASVSPSPSTATATAHGTVNAASASGPNSAASAAPTPLVFKTHKETVQFRCLPMELYLCLTNAQRLSAFTRGPATSEDHVGGSFSLFNGSITGTYLELEPGTKIVCNWRMTSWPESVTSRVEITIAEDAEGSALTIKQTGIPQSEYNRTSGGWAQQYWQPIKSIFGFGGMTF